jgi:uncharacterized protein YndB with AHSA1/START domain
MTEHVEVPIERVFELCADFKRYPEWNVSYSEITEVTGPVEVGTKIHGATKILGRTMPGQGEIVEVTPPRLLKLSATGVQGGTVVTTYRLTPVGTGTDMEIEVDYELPTAILGQIPDKRFVERTIERDLRHSLENFKALVQHHVPVLA